MLTVVQGNRVKNSRNNVDGWFDVAGASIANLLGSECKRECDLRYLSDKPSRTQCKDDCERQDPNIRLPDVYGGNIGQDSQKVLMYGVIGLAAIYMMTKKK